MDDNKIKNVKLNLEISQDAACVILDRLVRAAVDIPSAHDSNALIAYIDEQALLDNYPDGGLGVVIADHRSKLQAAYDCCTVALELYEAIEASREYESNEKTAPAIKVPEVSTQVSNEKPSPESEVPKGNIKVVFKIYTVTCSQPDAEASITWDTNKRGLSCWPGSHGGYKFHTRQDLLDYIILVLTPESSLKKYAKSDKYTTEEKEQIQSLTRKLLADLGVPSSEDYSGKLMWERVNL